MTCKWLTTTIILGFILIVASLLCAADIKPLVYVSPSGSDAWSGKLAAANAAKTDGPVATLERARDIVRDLKRKEALPGGSVVIELAGGGYELKDTFKLASEDSGTAGSPVVYRGRKGQVVRIIGGRVVTGFAPVTDPKILARLDPAARGKVLQADMKTQGLTDYPQMVSSTSWGSSDPGMEVFFADEPMTLARWPNEGYTRIVDVKGPTHIDGQANVTKEGIFTYEGDRPNRWLNEPDLMTNGYWMYDWADQRFRVQSIDTAAKSITLENSLWHVYGFRRGQWYYIYNALSELDTPSEWYLDRQKGVLYFWPPKPVNKGKTIVSTLRDLVDLQGVSYVDFEGLTFECTQAGAFNIQGGQNCIIRKCVVRNIGGTAVNIVQGLNHTVFGCDMYNLGSGGVYIDAGDRMTLTPCGHNVENCHIYKFGRWNPITQPAAKLQGVGSRVAHNVFNDAPHMAIYFNGNDMTIEYNEIHSVVYESNDAGVIYGGRDWTMRGNLIRHNYIHDIYGFESRGCIGVYLDDQFSSANIFGNVFYRVPMATHMGGGRDISIENNIYVDCNPAISVDARGLGWHSYGIDVLTERLNAVPYQSEPWRSRYPELINILQEDPMAPKNILVSRNICVGGNWKIVEDKASPGVAFKDNLLDQDPLFVDAKNHNYNLKPNSPAWKLGFKPIPIGKIGLYKDPLRASWPIKTKVRPAPKKPMALDRTVKPFIVTKSTDSPTIDGILALNEWPKTVMMLQEDPARLRIQGKPAVAHFAHDRNTLYVAVTVPITDRAALKLGSVWGENDGTEICFRPADKDIPAFVVRGYAGGRFRSDPDAGITSEAADALGRVTHFAAKVSGDNWTGEWAIPLSGAGIKYKPGLKLAFNIGVRRIESGEWIVWCGALGQNWKVQNCGVIVLR